MLRAIVFTIGLLSAVTAATADTGLPRLATAAPDWQQAKQEAGDAGLAALNTATAARFPDIDKSSVPVLLPFDKNVLASFQATSFFQAGPAGYDASFALNIADVKELSDIRYKDPVFVVMSGLRFTYDLGGPALPEGQPAKELDDSFPGITRTLHEHHVRYSFTRYGVTYVAAIFCRDVRPRANLLTCKQADRIAVRFLRALRLAGGNPQGSGPTAPIAVTRPEKVSPDFSYFSPGFIIPDTGRNKGISGRADDTVYAQLRFPMKDAPAFVNSQSFNNWGDCAFTGRTPKRLGKKGLPYKCNVNGRPLVFDESAGANYSYPWRDNFCEFRNFLVGQCPAGEGHQGQDIRPKECALKNEGADRCEPYRDEVVAVHDGMIMRAPKQEAAYLYINTPDTHVRVRYMHLNPEALDGDGVLNGKTMKSGDRIGLLAAYNEHERGTTYHLHFDMQVPTRIGYVFVNPYMSLVTAYERQIGARGVEIKDGAPVPPLATVPPVILQPSTTAVPLPDEKPAPAQADQKPAPEKAAGSKAPPKKSARKTPRTRKAKRAESTNPQQPSEPPGQTTLE